MGTALPITASDHTTPSKYFQSLQLFISDAGKRRRRATHQRPHCCTFCKRVSSFITDAPRTARSRRRRLEAINKRLQTMKKYFQGYFWTKSQPSGQRTRANNGPHEANTRTQTQKHTRRHTPAQDQPTNHGHAPSHTEAHTQPPLTHTLISGRARRPARHLQNTVTMQNVSELLGM